MRKALYIILPLALLLGGWLLWPDEPEPTPVVSGVVFANHGAEVSLSRAVAVKQVKLRSADGRILLDKRMQQVVRQKLNLNFAWQPGREYDLSLAGPWGSLSHKLTSPKARQKGLQVILNAPFTNVEDSGGQASVATGAGITCALRLKNYLPGPCQVRGRLELGTNLTLIADSLPSGAVADGNNISFNHELAAPGEDFALLFKARGNEPGPAAIKARVEYEHDGQWQDVKKQTGLNLLTPEEMGRVLVVVASYLPTGKDGLKESRNAADTVYYKPRLFRKITRWLGIDNQRVSYWLPFCYQALVLKNTTRSDMSLVVRARVAYADRDTTPEPFIPPDVFAGAMKNDSVAVAINLAPGATERVVLPFFITAPPATGTYRRMVVINPLGSSQELKRLELPLYITGMNYTALAFTLGSLLLSIIALAMLAMKFRRLITSLKIRQVVVIALFGALTFAGVNLPIKVFGAFFYGLMGPFSIIITGFFSELLYFALLVSLLRLIPRPGVIALLTLVRYLLSVLVTGGFHLNDFIYVGSSIAIKEAACYLAGLTRRGTDFSWSLAATCWLALWLSIGDALLSASAIYAHTVLFRLYFADWYIWLNLVVNGFMFTAMGVFLGRRFSRHLIWMEQ